MRWSTVPQKIDQRHVDFELDLQLAAKQHSCYCEHPRFLQQQTKWRFEIWQSTAFIYVYVLQVGDAGRFRSSGISTTLVYTGRYHSR